MDMNQRTISIDEKIKVLKLKVKVGTMIYDGRVLLIYVPLSDDGKILEQDPKKLKSPEVGVVRRILIKEGDVVAPGSPIIELEKKCNHPTVIKDLCAECGADLQKEDVKEGAPVSQASVSMVHMVPELKVNEELAQMLGKADMERLLAHKKLVLLVDLDQTLIHTTNDNIPNNIKDVYHFQLYGPRSPWYHTRLRPGTHNFLQGISEKYELHICTFGSRRYAHMIAGFLDPRGKFFSHRILSRDECFDPNSKTANLKALFPCGENMVCIIDDREDVWDYASNLIHVKPYHFFQHTGDIHAPPGLTKCENDDNTEGFDFSQFDNPNEEENLEASEKASEDAAMEEINAGDTEKAEEVITEVERDIKQAENINSKEVIKNNSAENSISTKLEINSKELNGDVRAKLDFKEDVAQSKITVECSEDAAEITSKQNPLADVSVKENESESKSELAINKLDLSLNLDKVDNTMKVEEQVTSISVSPIPKSIPSKENGAVVNPVINKECAVRLESKIDADGFIVIEEDDDYLLYLEEILKTIHAEFIKRYEESGKIPNLKEVIPEKRATVLQGVSIVFSGIVPNRIKLEDSPAYKIARSLGAKVTQNIEVDTTHLVALRAGTAKVHAAYKRKNLKLVTPDWLWTCAERWEKVDERLFPLKNTKPNNESRNPPAHCRSPEHPEQLPFIYQVNKSAASPTPVGGFINPLISLTSEDIQTMEGEVEDMFKESDEEADVETEVDVDLNEIFPCDEEEPEEPEDDKKESIGHKKRKLEHEDSSSSFEESEGSKRKSSKFIAKLKKRKNQEDDAELGNDLDDDVPKYTANKEDEDDDDDDDETKEVDSDDETINSKFRRGMGLPSDLDLEYNTEEGTEEDVESDGEWNVMGAALEREFLEGD